MKGNDVTKNALKGTKDGLGEIKSMSLETKAAIAAVVYGLERMMSGAVRAGTDLRNLADYTGESTKFFQQWEYGARHAGIASAEADASIKSVQGTMQKMLMGQGAPSGFAAVANAVGLDKNKLGDVKYVMGQLREFAKTVPPQIGNEMLKSFGLSENMIAGIRRGAFDESVLSRAPVQSDAQLKALNKVDGAWRDLGYRIDMVFAKFSAKHGMQLVGDIGKVVGELAKLIDVLTVLAEKLKLFQVLGKTMGLFSDTIGSANRQIEAVQNPSSYKSNLEPGKTGYIQMWKDAIMNDMSRFMDMVAPQTKALPSTQKNQPVTINQTNQFNHDGSDPRKVSDSHEKAAVRAYRSMQAQVVNN